METSKNSANRSFSFVILGCSNIIPIHLLTISSVRSKTFLRGRLSLFPIRRIMLSTISDALLGSGSSSVFFSVLFQRWGKLVITVSERSLGLFIRDWNIIGEDAYYYPESTARADPPSLLSSHSLPYHVRPSPARSSQNIAKQNIRYGNVLMPFSISVSGPEQLLL